MTNSFTSDELLALAKFPFTDSRWKVKFLIGCLLILVGFVIPWLPMIFVYGYCAQIMRRIIVENESPFLPEWTNWDKLFKDGLKLFGVQLIYTLPGFIFFFGGFGLFVVAMISSEATSEMLSRDTSPLTSLIPLVGFAGWFGGVSLGMLLVAAGLVILPVASGHFIATGQFGAAFRIREWWAIFRANLSGYLISYVLILGFWMALSFAFQILYFTVIFCCLMPFVMAFAMMYVMIIASILFGQAYQDGVRKLALPVATP